MGKRKYQPSPVRRLWIFWQRRSIQIYAAGALYLMLNLLIALLTAPATSFSNTPDSRRWSILLSSDETFGLLLLALLVGLSMLAAVIGDFACHRAWRRALALFAAGFFLWSFASIFVVTYAMVPRTVSADYGGRVYHL